MTGSYLSLHRKERREAKRRRLDEEGFEEVKQSAGALVGSGEGGDVELDDEGKPLTAEVRTHTMGCVCVGVIQWYVHTLLCVCVCVLLSVMTVD